MNNFKNINLEVANFALQSIKDAKENCDEKKYKTLVKKMTSLIQKNGLIGTLVFVLSKIKNDDIKKSDKKQKTDFNKVLLNQIIDWCKTSNIIKNVINKDVKLEELKKEKDKDKYESYKWDEFINRITTLNPTQYRILTREIMVLFGWMKRFADGMIVGEDDGEEN